VIEEIGKVKEFLESKDFVAFALLFGSFASGKATDVSDVDLGIYLKSDIPILEYGGLVSQLESLTGRRVDLVILNNLYEENPRFAYQIVSQEKLLFTKNRDLFTDYKRKVFLYYLDAAPMLRLMDETFLKRIEEGNVGDRNYIGKIKNT